MYDENTYLLNRHLEEQERLEREYQHRLEHTADLVGEMATALLKGTETVVGNQCTDRNEIAEECLHDGKLRKAMNLWTYNGISDPLDDLIYRAAKRHCAAVLGLSLADLALVPTIYPNFSQEEIERFSLLLNARIDTFLPKPEPKPCTYVDMAEDSDGTIVEVVGRGRTLEEARKNAEATTKRLYPIEGEKAA